MSFNHLQAQHTKNIRETYTPPREIEHTKNVKLLVFKFLSVEGVLGWKENFVVFQALEEKKSDKLFPNPIQDE